MVIIKGKYKRKIGYPLTYICAGSFYSPKINESKPLGDDAHFICEEAGAIGVADGVGAWTKRGIDSGKFSRKIMHNAVKSIKNHAGGDIVLIPKQVLYEAFSNTGAKGYSTASIITLSGTRIRAANLGDSGFMIMRRGKIVYTSPTQQHEFNSPYQLGNFNGANTPRKAEEITVDAQCYDIIIAGTDGLFHNMFPEDIEAVVKHCLELDGRDMEPNVVACALASAAHRNSLDKTRCSPFEIQAREAGVRHFGGKYDDITVIVAYIFPNT